MDFMVFPETEIIASFSAISLITENLKAKGMNLTVILQIRITTSHFLIYFLLFIPLSFQVLRL